MLLYCCITKFILVMQVYSQDNTGSGVVALNVDLRIVHRMSSVTEQLRYQLPNKLNTQTDYLRGGCTSLDHSALLLLVLHLILDYWAREEKIVGGHIWWYQGCYSRIRVKKYKI